MAKINAEILFKGKMGFFGPFLWHDQDFCIGLQ